MEENNQSTKKYNSSKKEKTRISCHDRGTNEKSNDAGFGVDVGIVDRKNYIND